LTGGIGRRHQMRIYRVNQPAGAGYANQNDQAGYRTGNNKNAFAHRSPPALLFCRLLTGLSHNEIP
jgi:hypothetical protein